MIGNSLFGYQYDTGFCHFQTRFLQSYNKLSASIHQQRRSTQRLKTARKHSVYFCPFLVIFFHCCTTHFLLFGDCSSILRTLCNYVNRLIITSRAERLDSGILFPRKITFLQRISLIMLTCATANVVHCTPVARRIKSIQKMCISLPETKQSRYGIVYSFTFPSTQHSHLCAFDWYQNQRPWMTLKGHYRLCSFALCFENMHHYSVILYLFILSTASGKWAKWYIVNNLSFYVCTLIIW